MLLQDFCFRNFAPPEQQLQFMGRHMGDCRMGKIRESVGGKKNKEKRKNLTQRWRPLKQIRCDSGVCMCAYAPVHLHRIQLSPK